MSEEDVGLASVLGRWDTRRDNPHEEPARFVCAWPNFGAVLGVDMGSGLEQLETAREQ